MKKVESRMFATDGDGGGRLDDPPQNTNKTGLGTFRAQKERMHGLGGRDLRWATADGRWRVFRYGMGRWV